MKRQSSRAFDPGVKLWIANAEKEGVFGEGRYRLLRAVAEYGSLRRAAQANNISYRKAWGDIRSAEKRLGLRLMVRERGGAGGGASCLTVQATSLLNAYSRFRDEVIRYAGRQFKQRLRRFLA